jgi:hypothetical protein
MASWPPAHLTPVDPAAILNGDGEFAALFAEAFGTIGKDGVAGKAGEPLRLRDWQKELLKRLYARDERWWPCGSDCFDWDAAQVWQVGVGFCRYWSL